MYLHKYVSDGKSFYMFSKSASKPTATIRLSTGEWQGRASGSNVEVADAAISRIDKFSTKEEEEPKQEEKKEKKASERLRLTRIAALTSELDVIADEIQKAGADDVALALDQVSDHLESREALFGLGKPKKVPTPAAPQRPEVKEPAEKKPDKAEKFRQWSSKNKSNIDKVDGKLRRNWDEVIKERGLDRVKSMGDVRDALDFWNDYVKNGYEIGKIDWNPYYKLKNLLAYIDNRDRIDGLSLLDEALEILK